MARPTTQQAVVPLEELERQLKRLLMFAPLANAPRLADFLRYVVAETAAGRGAALKQYTIAVCAKSWMTTIAQSGNSTRC